MVARIIMFIVSVGLLAGCAAPVPIDTHLAQLMPDSIARGVIEKRLGTEWANAPFVEKRGSCTSAFLGNSFSWEKESISFTDINIIRYNQSAGKLLVMTEPVISKPFYSCIHMKGFEMDKDVAKEVATALKALGACTGRNADKNC